MKLRVPNGDLNLPEGFSFEIEQNSAFFSDDGAASVAATIPATPADLAALERPTRIARNTRFANLFPAILSAGAFQKKGTLVVESASLDGITCAIALEDSDLYANHKETNLKELFATQVLTTYNTPAAWYAYLFNVYAGAIADPRFRLIPVSVNHSETGGYQVNNEPEVSFAGTLPETFPLKHSPRIVTEGDESVSVPEGYGIAPFYLLYAFLEDMFTLCGYSIGTNCFRTKSALNTLLLLHNCSDVICNGRIDCSDLVPNKTVQDILEWLRAKFHAQIVVHPAESTVDIVLLEDILSGSFDLDLTGKVLGHPAYSFSRSSRIVITPDTSLEGAAPAAETIEELKDKYGVVNEDSTEMGITLDRPTGRYYEIEADLHSVSGNPALRLIGTNYFRYDRHNSQEEEQLQPADLMPPMVYAGDYACILMPYIGERSHRNTGLKGSTNGKDEDQEIIIVDYAGRTATQTSFSTGGSSEAVSGSSSNHRRGSLSAIVSGRYFYGTTQKYDNNGDLRPGKYTLNAPEMYERFFAGYNKMLRNNLVKVEGQFDLPVGDILSYGMYTLKLLDGQKLLPVSLRYEVGRKVRCLSAAFYVLKDYVDGQEDAPTTVPAASYKWKYVDSEKDTAVAEVQEQNPEHTIAAVYDDEYSRGEKHFFIPAPTYAGMLSPILERTINIGYWWNANPHGPGADMRFDVIETRTINTNFISVAVS
ncbi:MAG: hypothetical protein J6O51_00845 [Bacteroidales bacterium]|nr:hypothetical protein [Bacteroidales bacterium]